MTDYKTIKLTEPKPKLKRRRKVKVDMGAVGRTKLGGV